MCKIIFSNVNPAPQEKTPERPVKDPKAQFLNDLKIFLNEI